MVHDAGTLEPAIYDLPAMGQQQPKHISYRQDQILFQRHFVKPHASFPFSRPSAVTLAARSTSPVRKSKSRAESKFRSLLLHEAKSLIPGKTVLDWVADWPIGGDSEW